MTEGCIPLNDKKVQYYLRTISPSCELTADSSVCPRVEKQKEKDPQTSKWDFKSNLWANLSALSQESQTLFLTHRDEHFEVSVFNEIVP